MNGSTKIEWAQLQPVLSISKDELDSLPVCQTELPRGDKIGTTWKTSATYNDPFYNFDFWMIGRYEKHTSNIGVVAVKWYRWVGNPKITPLADIFDNVS